MFKSLRKEIEKWGGTSMQKYEIDFEKVCAIEHWDREATIYFDAGATMKIEMDDEMFEDVVQMWRDVSSDDMEDFLCDLLEEL